MIRQASRGRIGPVVLGSLLIVLILLAAIAAQNGGSTENQPAYPTYDVHSSGPGGTRALSLWLASTGYRPTTLEYQPFRLDQTERLLFMLFPSLEPTDQEKTSIIDWVRQGGTLVIATGDQSSLFTELGLDVFPNAAHGTEVFPVEPSLNNPPMMSETVNRYATLKPRDPSWIPVLDEFTTGHIIGATRVVGQGTVLAFTTGDFFSNEGLAQPGNRNLMLNILARIPSGSGVAIDEYHHGLTEQGTFSYQLVRQPWGWAILYLAAVIFVYIALNGRRFGRAVRPYAQSLRRTRSEFAATLASMLHQNRQRDWLRERYVEQLKRSLGARFRVQSNLPATLFVEQLTFRHPEATALSGPLTLLEADRAPDEGQLVALIRESEIVAARLIARSGTNRSSVTRSGERLDEPAELIRRS